MAVFSLTRYSHFIFAHEKKSLLLLLCWKSSPRYNVIAPKNSHNHTTGGRGNNRKKYTRVGIDVSLCIYILTNSKKWTCKKTRNQSYSISLPEFLKHTMKLRGWRETEPSAQAPCHIQNQQEGVSKIAGSWKRKAPKTSSSGSCRCVNYSTVSFHLSCRLETAVRLFLPWKYTSYLNSILLKKKYFHNILCIS